MHSHLLNVVSQGSITKVQGIISEIPWGCSFEFSWFSYFLSIPQSALSALNSGVTSYGNPKHVP
ncbi:hypothetical protein MCC02031_18800 [Bifidobacteriaceae bacterium MCC02031]|nr:hypothetical protein MCC02031_18800 [Bifidobacteriaceae bacterium MCC02031]